LTCRAGRCSSSKHSRAGSITRSSQWLLLASSLPVSQNVRSIKNSISSITAAHTLSSAVRRPVAAPRDTEHVLVMCRTRRRAPRRCPVKRQPPRRHQPGPAAIITTARATSAPESGSLRSDDVRISPRQQPGAGSIGADRHPTNRVEPFSMSPPPSGDTVPAGGFCSSTGSTAAGVPSTPFVFFFFPVVLTPGRPMGTFQ
jgi:hypothetical protein